MKKIIVIGGGTISYVRNHLALCAPAFGTTAEELAQLCIDKWDDSAEVTMMLTKMADPECLRGEQPRELITNEDVMALVEDLKKDMDVKVVFFNVAMCDYEGSIVEAEDVLDGALNNTKVVPSKSGKYEERLKTSQGRRLMMLTPAEKVISTIRDGRKDIFLVGFKTTCDATRQEQYIAGLDMLKRSSCNLVLANDVKTRVNVIITPEESRYHESTDRASVLEELVDMAYLRSQLTFTQSKVIEGSPVSWDDMRIPKVLREIVGWCIGKGAYKEFNGSTVGHFACKIGENEFLTSIRKTNFNDIQNNGMVRVVTDGPDTVLAYGAKPSVGGQSQRIVFNDHPEYDCILHFHCPMREDAKDPIPVVSQREYECGSHQCGENTSKGLKKFGNLSCVMLDNHGPNIVFNKSIDLHELIGFIKGNFNLKEKTGGLVSTEKVPESVTV